MIVRVRPDLKRAVLGRLVFDAMATTVDEALVGLDLGSLLGRETRTRVRARPAGEGVGFAGRTGLMAWEWSGGWWAQ